VTKYLFGLFFSYFYIIVIRPSGESGKNNCVWCFVFAVSSVADAKLLFSEPVLDPTWRVITDPDPDPSHRGITDPNSDPTLQVVSDSDPSKMECILSNLCFYHNNFFKKPDPE